MSSTLICLRLLGYATSILLHSSNIVSLADVKFDIESEDIKKFRSLQNRYFTCWTFFLQMIHALLGICCETLILSNYKRKDYKLPKHLRGARDTLFSAIIFPTTFLVTTVFWSLFLYDRELILPKFVDQVLTPTSNHIMHTCIIPLTLWEVMFQPRYRPRSHFRNLAHLTFHMALYLSVLSYTYVDRGFWIYPIFGLLQGYHLYLSFALIFAIATLFYMLQWPLTQFIWGKHSVNKQKKLH